MQNNFHKFVNSKRTVSLLPALMSFNGTDSSGNSEIPNLFADYFQRNFSIARLQIIWLHRVYITLWYQTQKNVRNCHFQGRTSEYLIYSHNLENADSSIDIVVLCDQRLHFNLQIELSIKKAKSALAFIKRWSKNLNDQYAIKRLYMSLARPLPRSCGLLPVGVTLIQ